MRQRSAVQRSALTTETATQTGRLPPPPLPSTSLGSSACATRTSSVSVIRCCDASPRCCVSDGHATGGAASLIYALSPFASLPLARARSTEIREHAQPPRAVSHVLERRRGKRHQRSCGEPAATPPAESAVRERTHIVSGNRRATQSLDRANTGFNKARVRATFPSTGAPDCSPE